MGPQYLLKQRNKLAITILFETEEQTHWMTNNQEINVTFFLKLIYIIISTLGNELVTLPKYSKNIQTPDLKVV